MNEPLENGDKVAFVIVVQGKQETHLGFYNALMDEFVAQTAEHGTILVQRLSAIRWEKMDEQC